MFNPFGNLTLNSNGVIQFYFNFDVVERKEKEKGKKGGKNVDRQLRIRLKIVTEAKIEKNMFKKLKQLLI